MNKTERLLDLKEKQNKLADKIKSVKASVAREQYKEKERLRYLLGGYLFNSLEGKSEDELSALYDGVSDFLKRNKDKVFLEKNKRLFFKENKTDSGEPVNESERGGEITNSDAQESKTKESELAELNHA